MNTAVNQYNYRFLLTDYAMFDRNRLRQVAIYGRVSTEHEAQLSALESLTVTCEDAKAYMYSLSSKRRVHKWTDIQVNLYI